MLFEGLYGGRVILGSLCDLKKKRRRKFNLASLNHIKSMMNNQWWIDGIVFTGDTLFIGGCGRFFEGSAQEMYENLCVKISRFSDETRVFPGHE